MSTMKAIFSKYKLTLFVIVGVVGVAIIGALIFYFVPAKAVSTQQNYHDGQLIFAHTVCRHGDRNIYQLIPSDPWMSEKYWPGGYYQLTTLGKQQHYELGQYFRERYAKLIGTDGNAADNIFVQSTAKPRVIESAQANLAGFFSSDEHFDWKSIPIYTIPLEDDYILAVEQRCDQFDYLMIQYQNTTAYTGLFEENKSLIEYLEKKSGLKLRTLTNLADLYDTLFIERLKNFRLPLWAEIVMRPPSVFEELTYQWGKIFTATTEMKKLRSGFLLKEILNRFSSKTQSTLSSNRNLWMYFAHDITIANMLNSLGVFELHQPPYASCMFFELYHNNTSPFVQIFYRNTTQTDVPPLEIPNCGTECPLKRLYELYDDILPKNSVDEECELRDGETLPLEGNPESNSL